MLRMTAAHHKRKAEMATQSKAADASAEPAEEVEAEAEAPQSATVAARVTLRTWQKLNYLALRRSMQAGAKVTIGKTVGELLDKVAEELPDPPEDLISG